MKKFLMISAALCAMSTFASAADIAPGPVMAPANWFLHVGAAGVFYTPGFNNTPVGLPANSQVQLDNNFTGVVEAGRFLTNNFALAIAAGFPPTTNVAISSGGTVIARPGSVTFGSVMLLGQYHFDPIGPIAPYVGAGGAYNPTFSTQPLAPFTRFDVASGFGAVLQAGVDFNIKDNVGVFVDVKKMFASSDVTTTAFGFTAVNNVQFSPWIVSAGIGFRF